MAGWLSLPLLKRPGFRLRNRFEIGIFEAKSDKSRAFGGFAAIQARFGLVARSIAPNHVLAFFFVRVGVFMTITMKNIRHLSQPPSQHTLQPSILWPHGTGWRRRLYWHGGDIHASTCWECQRRHSRSIGSKRAGFQTRPAHVGARIRRARWERSLTPSVT